MQCQSLPLRLIHCINCTYSPASASCPELPAQPRLTSKQHTLDTYSGVDKHVVSIVMHHADHDFASEHTADLCICICFLMTRFLCKGLLNESLLSDCTCCAAWTGKVMRTCVYAHHVSCTSAQFSAESLR